MHDADTHFTFCLAKNLGNHLYVDMSTDAKVNEDAQALAGVALVWNEFYFTTIDNNTLSF